MAVTDQPETRYFIGLTPEGWHLSIIAGPGKFDAPAVPHKLGETEVYPVSEAVCREWTADDDEVVRPTGEPGPDAARWRSNDEQED